MVFDDIVGQENVVRSLKNSISMGRISHAYLFSGPDGVGKSIAASILAAVLNCREKGLDPCGECSSCLKARDGNHPDIIHVKTQKSSISVEEIRELQMDMLKKPYEKGVRVYIIHDAEKMTEQAQNATLKTLEEPSGHIVIMLLTSNRYSLLSTIISRCQVLNFTRAPEKDIEEFLESKHSIPKVQAGAAAAFSDGIVKKALEFVNDSGYRKTRDEVIDISTNLYKKDKLYVMSRIDYFIDNKDKVDSILDIMMSWFRDILIYKECGNIRYIMNLDRAEDVVRECGKYSSESLNRIMNYIGAAARNLMYNVNYQLSIETMLLNIQEG